MSGLRIANEELERMWKETCSALTFTGVVRDNHDRPVTLTYFPSQDLNLGVSWIWNRNANCCVAVFCATSSCTCFTSGLFNGSVTAIYYTAFSGIMISEYWTEIKVGGSSRRLILGPVQAWKDWGKWWKPSVTLKLWNNHCVILSNNFTVKPWCKIWKPTVQAL